MVQIPTLTNFTYDRCEGGNTFEITEDKMLKMYERYKSSLRVFVPVVSDETSRVSISLLM